MLFRDVVGKMQLFLQYIVCQGGPVKNSLQCWYSWQLAEQSSVAVFPLHDYIPQQFIGGNYSMFAFVNIAKKWQIVAYCLFK